MLARKVPKRAWQKLSAGAGAKGHRFYDWAVIDLTDPDVVVLPRRRRAPRAMRRSPTSLWLSATAPARYRPLHRPDDRRHRLRGRRRLVRARPWRPPGAPPGGTARWFSREDGLSGPTNSSKEPLTRRAADGNQRKGDAAARRQGGIG